MQKNPANSPKNSTGLVSDLSRIKVAILALPEVLALDFGIPIQILGRNTPGLYDVATCAAGGRPVVASGGFSVAPDRGLDLLAEADTVIIPGYTRSRDPLPDNILGALVAAHQRGARMVSICSGAFALAQAGILDGLSATTHWESTADLARLFPRITVDENVLFVDNGQVLTSAGVAAGIDLCLHLVRSDWGVAQGNLTARSIVSAPRREGTQSQFIEHRPMFGNSDQPTDVAAAMEWATKHMHQPITIADICAATALSERTLARRFEMHAGTTPMKWLANQRVERAKGLLETTMAPIDRIASSVGLGSGTNFRSIFKKSTSLTPSQYRHAFSAGEGLQP
ncbi:transcriptional regulator GlxA family with amidase domain [Psychromicrobium silvestre]|uniref:Transcriptional regulator GlxA family with amidase domain n=1 Tax=Psychromicrobium silvestre TaxID=1645614 RepID=A0A7Y9LR60_9MICC|nr:DJ-1/PfpI family protein [Psychromicrobium silvestre]NYE94082.1 transcriptional regulator GlxA family with amidase domain [Psychromicrobium silvestre]